MIGTVVVPTTGASSKAAEGSSLAPPITTEDVESLPTADPAPVPETIVPATTVAARDASSPSTGPGPETTSKGKKNGGKKK